MNASSGLIVISIAASRCPGITGSNDPVITQPRERADLDRDPPSATHEPDDQFGRLSAMPCTKKSMPRT